METPWPSIYTGELLIYLTHAAYRTGFNRRSLVDDQWRDLAYREVLMIFATLASFPFARADDSVTKRAVDRVALHVVLRRLSS